VTTAELMTNACVSRGSRPCRQRRGSLANPGFAGGERQNPAASFFRATALRLVPPCTWISEPRSALRGISTFISLKVGVGFLMSRRNFRVGVSSSKFPPVAP